MTVIYSKPVQFQSDGCILNESLTLYQTCVQACHNGIFLFPIFFYVVSLCLLINFLFLYSFDSLFFDRNDSK